jgi:hypothetical protein
MKNIIALVFDYDDTLAPDTISRFLESHEVDVIQFWRKTVDPLIADGWDPVPAMMYSLIKVSRTLPDTQQFTKTAFLDFGKTISFFPGVTAVFNTLREQTADIAKKFHSDIELEYYIISSGIDDLITSSRIAKYFTDIWANSFFYDIKNGKITFPKRIISFTDKTRYLFYIKKGLIKPGIIGKPFEVNRKFAPDEIRVPFQRMIFVGDGLTDVPCFALLQKFGGTAIAVYDQNHRENWGRAWGFTQSDRVTNIAPADFRKNSALHDSLIMAIERICTDIALVKRTYIG